jgi:hypothetical protein
MGSQRGPSIGHAVRDRDASFGPCIQCEPDPVAPLRCEMGAVHGEAGLGGAKVLFGYAGTVACTLDSR